AGEFQRARGDRRVWDQGAEEIRRTRGGPIPLLTRRCVAWQLGWKCRRARLCASVNRCCATVAFIWYRGAETKISSARRWRRNFGVRADGSSCRIRPGGIELES